MMKFGLLILAQFVNSKGLPHPGGADGPGNDTLKIMMDIMFSIAGAIALLVVVIAGFRYIRAGSNETIVAESRRQLAHAIVGLIVVASAGLIVNFVLGRA